jgi:hypothetical protein
MVGTRESWPVQENVGFIGVGLGRFYCNTINIPSA